MSGPIIHMGRTIPIIAQGKGARAQMQAQPAKPKAITPAIHILTIGAVDRL